MENKVEKTHTINIVLGGKITITALHSVVSFDEKEVVLNLTNSSLVLLGAGFEVINLCIESGVLELSGNLSSLKYSGAKKKESLLKRLVK